MNKMQFEDLKCIIREGWLEKESRFLKKWHKRWIVLTYQSIYSFKKEKQYINPTEIINLNSIDSIRQDSETQLQNSISIQTNDCIFNFKLDNQQDQQRWISLISSQMVKLKQQQ